MDLLISGATVLTMDADLRVLPGAFVGITGSRISFVGLSAPTEKPKKIMDATGMVLMPGLIDCHTHLTHSILRNYRDDLPPVQRLEEELLPKLSRMDKKTAQAAAIVAYIPVGIVATKIGRKKTILGGVVMLTVAFVAASFLRAGSPVLLMNVLFALAGIGWATINVNSFPMVVEMCSGGDIGKYTGFYYTASMSAQIVTPMLSGFFMDMKGLGMTVLFPYAAIFAGLAFVTMLFVKHGDAKPEGKKGLEALDIDD